MGGYPAPSHPYALDPPLNKLTTTFSLFCRRHAISAAFVLKQLTFNDKNNFALAHDDCVKIVRHICSNIDHIKLEINKKLSFPNVFFLFMEEHLI